MADDLTIRILNGYRRHSEIPAGESEIPVARGGGTEVPDCVKHSHSSNAVTQRQKLGIPYAPGLGPSAFVIHALSRTTRTVPHLRHLKAMAPLGTMASQSPAQLWAQKNRRSRLQSHFTASPGMADKHIWDRPWQYSHESPSARLHSPGTAGT